MITQWEKLEAKKVDSEYLPGVNLETKLQIYGEIFLGAAPAEEREENMDDDVLCLSSLEPEASACAESFNW